MAAASAPTPMAMLIGMPEQDEDDEDDQERFGHRLAQRGHEVPRHRQEDQRRADRDGRVDVAQRQPEPGAGLELGVGHQHQARA